MLTWATSPAKRPCTPSAANTAAVSRLARVSAADVDGGVVPSGVAVSASAAWSFAANSAAAPRPWKWT